ncbi:YciI family protein [uncultured Fibrella sp.]|uniref:YciI family protein n=1 Tax=uncultured Fibrella sp. TaxID=1284596 RepID=UPI0035CA748E
MEKFMLIFHWPVSQATAYQQQSPEDMQAEIQKWNQWIGGIAAQHKMVGGESLMPFGKVMTNGGQVVTDGPFTEGKEIIGGYTLVTAASVDEAVELAKGCPIFDTEDGSVEVRPVVNFG